jgi:NAD(P)-dependent dehydrogenase (short-subunit alcohol dehydrogenase family)
VYWVYSNNENFLTIFFWCFLPVAGRVVNVSSLQGLKALENCSEELQEKFRCNTLTEGDLVDLMKKFVEDTKNEVHEREGWPNSAYGVSKLGVTVLSREKETGFC